jgi:predicted RNA-binding Zn-ribbon protein involved in translation (DUF1610 family)
MGIIDKTTHHLTCPQCGASEACIVLDKGSNWSGSHWQSGAKFERFETTWSGGGSTEPELVSATCKQCGAAARRSAA